MPKSKTKRLNSVPAPASPTAPPIHCACDSIRLVADLKPHPRNPNTHPQSQIELLAKVIATTGWRAPIVVSKRSGFITKGHGRLLAAKHLGLKEVPVDEQEYPSEEAELADMIADNRIAELAEMDLGALKDVLQDLDTGAFDMDITGFDTEALEELMTAAPPDSQYTRKIIAPTYEPSGVCPPINALVDTTKSDQLIRDLEATTIPEPIKAFLRLAARRHDIFNFSFIADFYAHADAETKAEFEKSALVIIDINQAIENGFVQMSKELAAQYGREYVRQKTSGT